MKKAGSKQRPKDVRCPAQRYKRGSLYLSRTFIRLLGRTARSSSALHVRLLTM
jgi:hypothetical protein